MLSVQINLWFSNYVLELAFVLKRGCFFKRIYLNWKFLKITQIKTWKDKLQYGDWKPPGLGLENQGLGLENQGLE